MNTRQIITRALFVLTLAAVPVATTSCSGTLTPAVVAQDVIIATNTVVSAAQAAWVAVYPLIPSDKQAEANKIFGLAIDTANTAVITLQAAIAAGDAQTINAKIVALQQAVAAIVKLVAEYVDLSKTTDAIVLNRVSNLKQLGQQHIVISKQGYRQ